MREGRRGGKGTTTTPLDFALGLTNKRPESHLSPRSNGRKARPSQAGGDRGRQRTRRLSSASSSLCLPLSAPNDHSPDRPAWLLRIPSSQIPEQGPPPARPDFSPRAFVASIQVRPTTDSTKAVVLARGALSVSLRSSGRQLLFFLPLLSFLRPTSIRQPL